MTSATALLGAAAWSIRPQETPGLRPAQEIMWRKLDLSHQILDALALEDFEALEAYSEDLVSVSLAGRELLPGTESYARERRQFQKAAAELGQAARARDTESAALAYVDVTLRCLRCHRMLESLPR